MATPKYTLTSYDPVYAIAPEVRFPEDVIREQALRWLKRNACKNGEEPQLTDKWVASHVEEVNNVEDLLVFVRFNLYKDNREIQELADQDVVCAILAQRLVEELPEELVQESVYAAHMRFDEMLRQNGMQASDYCAQRGITEAQLNAEVEHKAIQSLKEDSALAAYADYKNYTLSAEDFFAIIPGESIEDKAYKRRQIELDGRLPGMEEYARKTKALKEVMAEAMIKRVDDPNVPYVRYGDISSDVVNAAQQFPENFLSI